MFTIDGIAFEDIVANIKRTFAVTDRDEAYRTLDGEIHRSVIGTFYNYAIEIVPSAVGSDKYNQLYEIISAPEDKHTIQIPYGSDILQFEGYITNGNDELLFKTQNNTIWQNLSFNIIATKPQRYPNE